jgi:predicted transcriptional regulator
MAMTIRFDEEELDRLRRQAEKERRTMAEIIRLAVRDRIERDEHREQVRASVRDTKQRYGDVLDRLAES